MSLSPYFIVVDSPDVGIVVVLDGVAFVLAGGSDGVPQGVEYHSLVSRGIRKVAPFFVSGYIR